MKLASVLFSPELLVSLGRGTYEVTENALPADAEIYRTSIDVERECFCVTLKSEEFHDVAEGAKIPTLEPFRVKRIEEPEGAECVTTHNGEVKQI